MKKIKHPVRAKRKYTAYLNEEPDDVPFPQADDVRKLDSVIILTGKGCAIADMAKRIAFTKRQAYYYLAAARYLGLINAFYTLTIVGKKYTLIPIHERYQVLICGMFEHPVFRQVLDLTIGCGTLPDKQQIALIIQEHISHQLAKTTLARRAQTVRKWFQDAFLMLAQS